LNYIGFRQFLTLFLPLAKHRASGRSAITRTFSGRNSFEPMRHSDIRRRVPSAFGYGEDKDKLNAPTFYAASTMAPRVAAQLQPEFSVGIGEQQIK
jgi:hypothetical protein